MNASAVAERIVGVDTTVSGRVTDTDGDSDGSADPGGGDGSDIDDGLPGFGFAGALVAVLVLGTVLALRRTGR